MFPSPAPDPIAQAPDLEGPYAKAWKVDIAGALQARGIPAENDACLVHWIVEAPWAHPAWHSYSVVLVHLRAMPDGRTTRFYLEGATHEIWVYVLDPGFSRETALRTGDMHWLTPINFAAQFITATDDEARHRIQNAVQMILDGKLSPDTDFQRAWMLLFGDNMVKK